MFFYIYVLDIIFLFVYICICYRLLLYIYLTIPLLCIVIRAQIKRKKSDNMYKRERESLIIREESRPRKGIMRRWSNFVVNYCLHICKVNKICFFLDLLFRLFYFNNLEAIIREKINLKLYKRRTSFYLKVLLLKSFL